MHCYIYIIPIYIYIYIFVSTGPEMLTTQWAFLLLLSQQWYNEGSVLEETVYTSQANLYPLVNCSIYWE